MPMTQSSNSPSRNNAKRSNNSPGYFKDVKMTNLALRVGIMGVFSGITLLVSLAVSGVGLGIAFGVGLGVMALGLLIGFIAAVIQAKKGLANGPGYMYY